MSVLVLQMSGKDVAVAFIDFFQRSNPFALPVRVITTAGTLYDPKLLRGQLVRAEVKFSHVGFTIGVMPGAVLSVYYATMIATDMAEHKHEAIVAVEAACERSRLAHKSAPSFTVIGERCKEASFRREIRSVHSQADSGLPTQLIPVAFRCKSHFPLCLSA